MLNFSSISLANTRTKYSAFAAAYVLAFILYWPSFSGTPIWDDITYWFYDPIMKPQYTYSWIWSQFTWPLSVSAQKILYHFFQSKWWTYHSINFVLHAFNSWLFYRLLQQLRLKPWMAFTGFALFLLHPASVITVAWMIQLKTLICFTFGIGALVLYLERKNAAQTITSYILFILSILSKSSSLPLPFAMLFFIEKPVMRKRNLAIIPFFLIAAFGAYRINFSHVAVKGVKDALETTGKGFKKTKIAPLRQEEQAPPGEDEITPLPEEADTATYSEPTKQLVGLSPIAAKRRLFIKTLNYYFWQAYMPVHNAPVKGQNPYPPTLWDYVHLIFLCFLILISARFYFFFLLAAAHIFLLPYFGLIPAPYMNVTWVSDQHLYIALPFFLALLLFVVDHLKNKWKVIILSLLVVLFAVKTREAVAYYKDNTDFYKASINYNFNNIPLVYNLAIIYSSEGKRQEAIDLLEMIFSVSKTEPYLVQNKFFPYLVNLHGQLTLPGETK